MLLAANLLPELRRGEDCRYHAAHVVLAAVEVEPLVLPADSAHPLAGGLQLSRTDSAGRRAGGLAVPSMMGPAVLLSGGPDFSPLDWTFRWLNWTTRHEPARCAAHYTPLPHTRTRTARTPPHTYHCLPRPTPHLYRCGLVPHYTHTRGHRCYHMPPPLHCRCALTSRHRDAATHLVTAPSPWLSTVRAP